MRTLGRRQGGEGSVAVPSPPPMAPPMVSLHRDVTGNRQRQRGVDESFLSFRPGGTMMDGDGDDSFYPRASFVGSIMSSTSIDPNVNDESVEVYDDDEDTNRHDDRGAADRCGLSSPPYVNLHTSILDSSLDDDEDDDEVKSQLADNEEGVESCASDYPSTPQRCRTTATLIPPHSREGRSRASRKPLAGSPTPPPPPTTPRGGRSGGPSTTHELAGGGGRSSTPLVDLTDRLVGMCFGGVGTATPVPPPPPVSTPGSSGGSRRRLHYHPVPPSPHSYPRAASGGTAKGHRSKTSCVMDALSVVQEDMFQLLGCSHDSEPSSSPGQDAEGAHLQQPYWTEHSPLFCFHHRREASALLESSSSVDGERVLGRARPNRITFRERAERVRRYHAERSLPHKHTGLALLPNAPPVPTPAWARSSYHHPGQLPLIPCRRSRSLLDPPVARLSPTGRRRQQQKHQVSGSDDPMELGYDSDPEVVWGGESARAPPIPLFPLIASPQLIPEDEGCDDDDDNGRDGEFSSSCDTDRIVQETLNLSWTLKWHPPPSTSAGAGAGAGPDAGAPAKPAPRGSSSSAPVVVTAWLERGTLINGNTVMLEPAFMWRDAYHPPAATRIHESRRHRRHSSSQQRSTGASVSPAPVLPTPHSLKLLNVARILPGVVVPDGSGHRPVSARNGCSFTVQTVQGECIVFEAASPAERNRLVRRWKVAVARFVTLAILEQFEAMADEFFTPRTAVPGG